MWLLYVSNGFLALAAIIFLLCVWQFFNPRSPAYPSVTRWLTSGAFVLLALLLRMIQYLDMLMRQ